MHWLFFLLLFFPLLTNGQIPKPRPGTYINDYTGRLTLDEIGSLNEQLRTLEDKITVQVAVLLINHLPHNISIEEYARRVGNKWKVGKAFNGIVYVAVIAERKQRLEIARNLEGDIPDITAFELIESIKPFLQQQNYYAALSSLIEQIGTHLGVITVAPFSWTPNTYQAQEPTDDRKTYKDMSTYEVEKLAWEKKKATYDKYGNVAIGFIILGMIGFLIWAYRYKRKYRELHTANGVYYGIGSSYYMSIYGSNSSSSSGDSSGYGGFGGSGGGGFSGGGASGGW